MPFSAYVLSQSSDGWARIGQAAAGRKRVSICAIIIAGNTLYWQIDGMLGGGAYFSDPLTGFGSQTVLTRDLIGDIIDGPVCFTNGLPGGTPVLIIEAYD